MTRRLALQMDLPRQIAFARDNTAAYAQMLADVEPASVTSLEALATLPVTRKSELMKRQQQSRPFGGLATAEAGQMRRVYSSPGPIYEPEGHVDDYWRMGRALFAAGVRAGDLVHNTFSYHFTPAGFMFESGAAALGCGVFAAGVGQTELQVTTIGDLRPSVYAGTPSFLKIILDKATEMDSDVSSISKAVVGGEALPPSLRSDLQQAGISVRQSYGTADVALIAYESEAMEGLIVDENVIVEIVVPGTGDPVEPGQVGEVVVTTFSQSYPLVRFATGDMSAVMEGISPCGRTNTRIAGWMGRADQTTKVRGMFVRPEQVASIVARHPEIARARLVVDREGVNDTLTLHCETDSNDESMAAAVTESIRDICKLRGEVEMVALRSLPNDGKVIEDIRSYE